MTNCPFGSLLSPSEKLATQLRVHVDAAQGELLSSRLFPAPSGNAGLFKVHSRPLQSQKLTAAHSGVGRNRVEELRDVVTSVLADGLQQSRNLLGLQIQTVPDFMLLAIGEAASLQHFLHFENGLELR